jgi:hypothetical protein
MLTPVAGFSTNLICNGSALLLKRGFQMDTGLKKPHFSSLWKYGLYAIRRQSRSLEISRQIRLATIINLQG